MCVSIIRLSSLWSHENASLVKAGTVSLLTFVPPGPVTVQKDMLPEGPAHWTLWVIISHVSPAGKVHYYAGESVTEVRLIESL